MKIQVKFHKYLPHHAVFKESSSTRPQLLDDLFTLIMRFRSHRFALTANAMKMLRKVVVHPLDRNNQRMK